jgi:CheY-like chemotaxis protein/nitrogen-specific signal transduction histidine kinase
MKATRKSLILIVDDRFENIELLKNILSFDYEVKTVNNGKDAIKFTEEYLPDLILLDIMMPEMNGFEVCKKLKEIESTRPIPIIFITAMNEMESKLEGFKIGGVDYITKPFDQEEVMQRVKAHYTIRRQQIELEEAAQRISEANTKLDFTNKQLKEKIIQIKKANSDKFESENKLKSILQNFDISLWSTSQDGIFTLVEGNFEDQNFTSKQMTGKSFLEIYKKNPVFIEGIRKALNGETNTRIIKFGDSYKEVIFIPKLDEVGNNDGTFGLLFDITILKKTENELQTTKTELEKALMAKSEFFVNISHEILSPVNAIMGFCELLQPFLPDKNPKRYLESIINSSKILQLHLNDIIELSLIEVGQIKLNIQPVDIRALIKEVVDQINSGYQDIKLDIRINISPEISNQVMLDEPRLKLVIRNIIDTSINYTNLKSIEISARTQISETSECFDLIITINNFMDEQIEEQTDKEIESSEEQENQFEKIGEEQQLPLTLTRRLLDLMDGTITAISQNERLNVYEITLCNVSGNCSDYKSVDLVQNIDFKNIKIEKSVILIAEDMKAIRSLVIEYFKDTPVKVIEASDGKEALLATKKNIPDLILMDISLPFLNGIQTTKILKEQPSLKKIPVIALLSSSHEEGIVKDAKFEGVIKKPFTKEDFFNIVLKFLKYTNR